MKSCLQRNRYQPSARNESGSNKEGCKQRGVRTKSASRRQHVGVVVMSTDTLGKFWHKESRDGDRQCGKADASKDSAALLGQHSQATGHGRGVSHTQRHVNSTVGGGFESNNVSDTGTGNVRQREWRAYNATKEYHQQRLSGGAQADATWCALSGEHTQHGGAFWRISEEYTVVDEPARGGKWSRQQSWVSGPDQSTQPARVWGQMARMAKLDWWKACNKTDEGWLATGLVTISQVVAWHVAGIWKWRVVANAKNGSKV